jgi:hypothetical protein
VLAAGETRTQQVKKAKAAALFEQLQARAGGGGKPAGEGAAAGAAAGGGAKAAVDLAALCRSVGQLQQKRKKVGGDEVGEGGWSGRGWRRCCSTRF